MNLAEKINETFALSEAYSNIGSFYEYLKEYGSALKYYNKALEVDLKINNLHNIAFSYLTIGGIYIKLQRFENARDSLIKAQNLISKVRDKFRQAELYTIMADYYLETNQLDSAYQQIKSARKLTDKNNYDRIKADIVALEGDLNLKQKKYSESLVLFDKAIALYNQLATKDRLHEIYLSKATAFSQLGKHDKAYEILQMAQKINEDFKPNEIAKILGEFEHSEAIKEEKAKLRLEQEITSQKNEKELILMRAKLHGAILSIVFLVILIALVIYLYTVKRKHNSQLEENYNFMQVQKALLEDNFQELKLKEKKLSELNATKDKFFSIIAHDLKNPFNILIGLSDIVINNPDMRHSEEFEEIIDGMYQTATSGYNLLDNLLEWARSQTGDIENKPEMLDMNKIFTQNASFFNESAKAKKIEICIFNSANHEVFADYHMVNLIVRNLMNNAIKFSHPEGKIEIKGELKDKFFIFAIQDFGVGMSEQTQAKLFKIESTNPQTGTANEKGTGLGLIICKEFIEKIGGKIWVESELGKGSCFHFSLPDNRRKELKNEKRNQLIAENF